MTQPNESNQSNIDLLYQEATVHFNRGDYTKAEVLTRNVLIQNSNHPDANHLLGLIAIQCGQYAHAVKLIERATQLNPQQATYYNALSFALHEEGRLDDALLLCDKLLKQKPHSLDTLINRSLLLRELGRPEEALTSCDKAIELNPQNSNAHYNRAVALNEMSRLEDALASCEHAINLNPKFMAAYNLSALVLKNLGRVTDSLAACDQALKVQSWNPHAHWLLSGLQKARDRSHIQAMAACEAQVKQSPQAVAFLSYAAGKEYEDLEDWPAAFKAFSQGARARRQLVKFDEENEIQMFEALDQAFNEDWLQARQAGCDDPSPIFIVGQPRTGTTLVERIITSHSQVHSAGELQQFELSIKRLVDVTSPQHFSAEQVHASAALDPEQLGRAYIQASAIMKGSLPRFVDKLPTNFLHIPLIVKALPNAKIIHLTRNPMDCCFSSLKQLFAESYYHSYDQGEMARHFVRYHKTMALWRQRMPGKILDVHYEDVVTQLEPNARRIIDYLELPWEDACLDFHQQQAAVTTASAVQVREQVHTRSVGRWLKYRQDLAPMYEILNREGLLGNDEIM